MHTNQLINQKPYEKVVFFLHRHPLTFLKTTLLFLVIAALPVIFYYFLATNFPQFVSNFNVPISVFGSCFALAITVFYYFQFVEFYLDLWIVTNDRIIDIEQNGMFSKTISELDLYQIQDVTTVVNGMLPTLFNYGNVIIKTASNNEGLIFHDIPNPNNVRSQLISLANDDRKFHQVPVIL